MMIVMRKSSNNIRTTAKEASHERIVDAAARAIRRSGYDGTGVADIMKEAGLTHGAFYAHFASREAMLPRRQTAPALNPSRQRQVSSRPFHRNSRCDR